MLHSVLQTFNAKMSRLWQCFSEDIIKSLVYLANDLELVFSDLRIGYDITCNVMVHPTLFKMCLIDFESLTKRCYFIHQKNAFAYSYDSIEGNYSPLKLVWWQCFLVAHCCVSETLYKL
jgi:hypothetical protein